MQLELGLEGRLDSAALAAALCALVDRHASLPACFRHENLAGAVQVIVAKVSPPWREIDLSLLDEASREQRLAEIVRQERAERFDLSRAPLLRFVLIRLGSQAHRLVLSSHHILMDGWSLPVLVQELLTLYAHQGMRAPCRG